MTNNNIFLGSGTSVTFVPEVDIYLKPHQTAGTALTDTNGARPSGQGNKLTLHGDFTGNFDLVNDLYVGCVLEFHDVGAGTTHTAGVTTITFNSDVKADYDDLAVVFLVQPSAGGTAADSVVFFDHDASASYTGGVTPAGEADISPAANNTREEYATIFTAAVNALSNISATRSGAVVTVTNTHGGTTTATTKTELDGTAHTTSEITISNSLGTSTGSTTTSLHRVTTNDATTITFHPAITETIVPATDFFHLKGYGAPCPATSGGSNLKHLNADNWLGVVESLTFPSVDVEFKQQNLFVGGSRNFTHQYKGIETAGNASIGIVANHGAWLYYFFGKCSSISATLASGTNPTSDFAGNASSENKYYLHGSSLTDTGPLFYRSIDNVMTPPVLEGQDAFGDLDQLTESTVGADGFIDDPITYTFAEQDGDDLPSFAMEQVFSKLPSTNTYSTNTADADEDTNFALIATGNRVNTLTMTANENEELKMTMDCMPRKVHSLGKTEKYAARRSVTDETAFKNFSSDDKLLEPFFFSSGSISLFGQDFMRITQFSLTMNNTLTDKRFIGIGSRNVKDAIPAQRTYELTFSALVTDDKLFNELKNNDENQLADSGALIDLIFDKPNQEQIRLKFDNYYLTTNSWPIPEDKGAVTVDATIIPRSLSSCTVKTHWVLQG